MQIILRIDESVREVCVMVILELSFVLYKCNSLNATIFVFQLPCLFSLSVLRSSLFTVFIDCQLWNGEDASLHDFKSIIFSYLSQCNVYLQGNNIILIIQFSTFLLSVELAIFFVEIYLYLWEIFILFFHCLPCHPTKACFSPAKNVACV